MGPGRYPHYTRADFGPEAVGSSNHKHIRSPNGKPYGRVRSRKSIIKSFSSKNEQLLNNFSVVDCRKVVLTEGEEGRRRRGRDTRRHHKRKSATSRDKNTCAFTTSAFFKFLRWKMLAQVQQSNAWNTRKMRRLVHSTTSTCLKTLETRMFAYSPQAHA